MTISNNLGTEEISNMKREILDQLSGEETVRVVLEPDASVSFDVVTAQFILVIMHTAKKNNSLVVDGDQLSQEQLGILKPVSGRYLT